jgi:cation:H+ antiporter
MDWVLNISYLALGLVCLYYGAEWLVGGSSHLALRFGLTPLVIGLTVVAFGTSAPELSVSIGYNMEGSSDESLGNVVGSNICNLALVLGVSALIRPLVIRGQIVKREMPILIVASIALIAIVADGYVAWWEGLLLALGIIVYVVTSLRLARTVSPEIAKEFEDEFGELEGAAAEKSPLIFTALIVVGVITLVLGSELLRSGASFIARGFGVEETLITLTVVAFGTSLPELATSIVACMKNEGDIVAGNAVGSSIFNILAIVGITALIKPMVLVGELTFVDWCVFSGVTCLALVLMATRSRITRVEGGLLVAGYVGYYIYLGVNAV